MDNLIIDSKKFNGFTIPLPKASLLLIQGQKGSLCCGYLSIETAEKVGYPIAIVTGVSSYDDMLAAEVKKVSKDAAKLGIKIGMLGKEALLQLN